jgi:tRNA (guanine6-N2)-methyltransferase
MGSSCRRESPRARRPTRPPEETDRQPDFYLTVVRGLEDFAADEVARLGGRVIAARPGKVLFCFDGETSKLLGLRSAMNIFAFVAEHKGFPRERSARVCFERAGRELRLDPALSRHAGLSAAPDSPSFRITATRCGEHAYISQEIAAWVGTGVQAQTGWGVDLESYDYEIEVELVEDRALFGLHLGPAWRERRAKAVYHPASLNPTVAYAMIRLVGLRDEDVFLDPACGGGTLLAERAALGPARLIVGGDIWPRALEYAQRNLDAAGVRAHLIRWDAGRLSLRDSSVDCTVCNLPFGHRVGRGAVVRSFYHRLLPELARVLRPGGRAALLSSRHRWLGQALADSRGLRQQRRLRIVLGGKQAFIVVAVCSDDGTGLRQGHTGSG